MTTADMIAEIHRIAADVASGSAQHPSRAELARFAAHQPQLAEASRREREEAMRQCMVDVLSPGGLTAEWERDPLGVVAEIKRAQQADYDRFCDEVWPERDK